METISPVSLLITTGEPAGIGPELCMMWAARYQTANPKGARIVLVGDRELLAERAKKLGLSVPFREYDPALAPLMWDGIEIWHTPLKVPSLPGQLAVENSAYVLNTLDIAIDECLSGRFEAMVTAPIHKGIINEAGISFTGHTEYLAERAHRALVVMMLVGGGLRVALVTTHLPLRQVPDAITGALIEQVLTILHDDLKRRFGIARPRILVSGLNPHAGEDGHLGREEIDVIEPALKRARAQGIDCQGPIPADTLFLPDRLEGYDAVLTMYHDQGLPVLKYASFGGGSNITLGLPFIRTSVDHGTALSLAGTGKADVGSLETAIDHAVSMIEKTRVFDAQ